MWLTMFGWFIFCNTNENKWKQKKFIIVQTIVNYFKTDGNGVWLRMFYISIILRIYGMHIYFICMSFICINRLILTSASHKIIFLRFMMMKYLILKIFLCTTDHVFVDLCNTLTIVTLNVFFPQFCCSF